MLGMANFIISERTGAYPRGFPFSEETAPFAEVLLVPEGSPNIFSFINTQTFFLNDNISFILYIIRKQKTIAG